MRRLLPEDQSQMNWPLAILVVVIVSVLYTTLVIGYSLLPGSGITVGDPLWWTVGFSGLTSLGSIGVPVLLWGRYRLQSPVACLGLILLFWHVLAKFPPIDSVVGYSPAFVFVFVLAPIYIFVYGVVAVVEYRLRERRPGSWIGWS